VHGSRLSAADVARVAELLTTLPRPERAAIPTLHPGRVDVIAAGALILRTLVELSGVAEVLVSEHDILDGIVLSLNPRR
jgi:exopolyphosphatase/guanosine-5'-triphosphate,3'-diphosphate pyrophosphatase